MKVEALSKNIFQDRLLSSQKAKVRIVLFDPGSSAFKPKYVEDRPL